MTGAPGRELPATGLGTTGSDSTGSAALIVSGGGTTLVATDVVLAEAAALKALQEDAAAWLGRLRRIRQLNSDPIPAPQWSRGDVELSIMAATVALVEVESRSRSLADALINAADGYGRAERSAQWVAGLSGAWLGNALGRIAPLLALAAIPALTFGAVGLLLGSLIKAPAPAEAATRLGRWFGDNPQALTNPAVVAAVRVIVSSLDDAAAGTAGFPYPLSVALGDQGVGLFGVTTSAAGVIAAARPFGLLRETPVSVHRVERFGDRHGPTGMRGEPVGPAPGPGPTPGPAPGRLPGPARVWPASPTRPPTGFGDLVARIPPAAEDGPQVRIERYGTVREPSWIVYVGGTVEWGAGESDEPWDLTSNVVAVAEQGAGSYRAVLLAMAEAGVQPGDPVLEVGHSQGGLVATQVAASGEFARASVLTFGAPNAQVDIPSGVSALTVEHTDDLVVGLGGVPNGSDERLVVRREAFASEPVPVGPALPAHALTTYRETAALMDASEEPRLTAFRRELGETLGEGPGVVSRWRGVREAEGVVGGGVLGGGRGGGGGS